MTYLFKLVVIDDDGHFDSCVVTTFEFDLFIEVILFGVHDRSAIR
jgi:hypothetical protein